MTLEYLAARWLKWEKRAQLVLMQRGPREYHMGQPDVLGVLSNRHLLEIEVKRSRADFRANADKRHIVNRNMNTPETIQWRRLAARQFWFMVPLELVEKVRGDLPDYAGLMTVKDYNAVVVCPAPVNKEAVRLTIGECGRLMNCAGKQIISLMAALQNRDVFHSSDDFDDFHNRAWDTNFRIIPSGYTNYQI